MADFYYGTLEGGYGGRGGRGGKKSGVVSKANSQKGTTSKPRTPKQSITPKKSFASKAGGAALSVLENIPVVGNVVNAGEGIVRSFRGTPVQGNDGMMYMKRRKKKSKGLSGSDLKGYMRTVKLAKMLVHTPRYMKKSVGKARRRSSLSFR